jgi:hypothetical protein
LDDFCQLEDLYLTFKNESEEAIVKADEKNGKPPVEISFPSKNAEGAHEINFPTSGQPSKVEGLSRFEAKHGISLDQV